MAAEGRLKAARRRMLALFVIDGSLNCKILDLRFHALPDEITACHSSLGGEFGEWIDVVKDASFARAGAAGLRVQGRQDAFTLRRL